MSTYRYVAYSIQEQLKQFSDDSDIRLTHILYWIEVCANSLKVQHLGKGGGDTYLNIFPGIRVELDKERTPFAKYFELPSATFDLPRNREVEFIRPEINIDDCKELFIGEFTQINANEASRLYLSAYEKPSTKRRYFYRIGYRIYLLGIEKVNVPSVEIGLYTAVDTTRIVSLDDELDLPNQHIEALIYKVLALGKNMLIIPKDLVNTGNDDTVVTPPTKQQQQVSNEQ